MQELRERLGSLLRKQLSREGRPLMVSHVRGVSCGLQIALCLLQPICCSVHSRSPRQSLSHREV